MHGPSEEYQFWFPVSGSLRIENRVPGILGITQDRRDEILHFVIGSLPRRIPGLPSLLVGCRCKRPSATQKFERVDVKDEHQDQYDDNGAEADLSTTSSASSLRKGEAHPGRAGSPPVLDIATAPTTTPSHDSLSC